MKKGYKGNQNQSSTVKFHTPNSPTAMAAPLNVDGSTPFNNPKTPSSLAIVDKP